MKPTSADQADAKGRSAEEGFDELRDTFCIRLKNERILLVALGAGLERGDPSRMHITSELPTGSAARLPFLSSPRFQRPLARWNLRSFRSRHRMGATPTGSFGTPSTGWSASSKDWNRHRATFPGRTRRVRDSPLIAEQEIPEIASGAIGESIEESAHRNRRVRSNHRRRPASGAHGAGAGRPGIG